MTAAERKDLHAEIEALRQEFREAIAGIKQRLELLEKPKIARVVIDPSRPQDGS
jgi:hypothetical protein